MYGARVAGQLSESILHVDMDAFFVEVERRRNPSLVGRPVLVGGTGPRAVVAAASYEARQFGVGSAMPMGEARRRCPGATVVPPDHRVYSECSREVFTVLRSFTPHVEGLSVDEAFLDISGLRLHYEGAAEVGRAVRSRLKDEVGLPASVGGSTTKFLAKLASEEAKPDGMFIVEAGSELDFLHPLPVNRLWGVGQATLAGLEALGVETVGELAAVPRATLETRLGAALGMHLHQLANGIDNRSVSPGGEAKSVSVEETYDRDLRETADMHDALLALCDRLSARLNASGIAGRTITIKVRFGDFTTLTRSATLAGPVDHTPDLWDGARDLFARLDVAGRGIRLLGVGLTSLVPRSSPRQLSMDNPGREAASVAAEKVRQRFGADAVIPARLAAPKHGGEGARKPDDRL